MNAPRDQLEIVAPAPGREEALAELFQALAAAGDDRWFHPHPLDAAAAAERCRYRGRDVYCLVANGERALGYGMLRGWDEGYAIPSLGIAVHPAGRSLGIARAIMAYLHAEARRRGVRRIRLRVHPANEDAVRLYRTLGYDFVGEERGELLAFKDLP